MFHYTFTAEFVYARKFKSPVGKQTKNKFLFTSKQLFFVFVVVVTFSLGFQAIMELFFSF